MTHYIISKTTPPLPTSFTKSYRTDSRGLEAFWMSGVELGDTSKYCRNGMGWQAPI